MATDTANPAHTNRLVRETSPYLLQHAHNPVDWYAWGEEAFEAARGRDVPIFLSIGYSTCYWCHVMERESFEDKTTAALMNDLFVNVKVDREERPDIDDLYMAATQALTGRGGWPMSVWLDPNTLRPFWAGTYYPIEPRHGLPSFAQVLRGMSGAWADRRAEVVEQAQQLADAVKSAIADRDAPVAVGPSQVTSATGALIQQFDAQEGGFGGAPKFPQPVYLEFLLDARAVASDDATRAAIDRALTHTLDRMAVGGLFDQVGGGFHRYCVDGTWTVPHFEKMLYDNGQLASVYARAAEIYGDDLYARTLRRTLDYVLREMTGDDGRFFSAQDAEVRGREGLNYLWVESEVRDTLDADDAAFACAVYGLDRPNFADPHHPGDGPRCVLRLEERPERVAESMGLTQTAFLERLDRVNAALLKARDRREQPGLDDKTLASWNGIMILGFVRGAAALGETSYLDAAERAARFILDAMRDDEGGLIRSSRAGTAKGGAVLEDYAHMIRALVALDAVRRANEIDTDLVDHATRLAEIARVKFGDEAGAYFDTEDGASDLFVRARSTYDGATPSGSSVMAHALLDLAEAHRDGGWADRAAMLLRSMSAVIDDRAVAAIEATRAVLRLHRPSVGWDHSASERMNEGLGASGRVEETSDDFTPIEIHADAERVVVKDGEPAVISLKIMIAPGYHILAADPIADGSDAARGLIGLRAGLISGSGVKVYADYPEGDPYGAEFTGTDELLVHTGEVELRIMLERAEGIGASPGDPVLGLTYQACDDSSCREPRTVELDIAVDLA